jgi:ABC-2 type transport system permease protein
MQAIYLKELAHFFKTTQGYVYLAVSLFMLGLLYTLQILFNFSADLPSFLQSAQLIFFFSAPLLTMRLFNEERRHKTDILLFTAPISLVAIMLGKSLATFTLFAINLLFIGALIILTTFFGQVDMSRTLGSFIGYFLLGFSFICLGIFVSVVTESQITAALLTFALVFSFWLLPVLIALLPVSGKVGLALGVFIIFICFMSFKNNLGLKLSIIVAIMLIALLVFLFFKANHLLALWPQRFLSALSLSDRYDNFVRGIINAGDVVFYLSFSTFFIYFSYYTLAAQRKR